MNRMDSKSDNLDKKDKAKSKKNIKNLNEKTELNTKELEALDMIMNKVEGYRRNTFVYLRDKEDIDKMISYIRIYKEQSD